jgi:hypothetical protein
MAETCYPQLAGAGGTDLTSNQAVSVADPQAHGLTGVLL